MNDSKRVIDEKNVTLTEWLDLITPHPEDRDYIIMDWQFPTEALKDEYLSSIQKRTDREVKNLLRRFLIESCTLGKDKHTREWWLEMDTDRFVKLLEECEFAKRLMSGRLPWEGITWILDLLPDSPNEAINGLDAYISAHIQLLPDGRFTGLTDAISIIRSRYFEYEHARDHIMSRTSRDFEYLVAALFNKMGFETTVTQSSRDGGYDVIAHSNSSGSKETVLIECKLHNKPVGVKLIREFAGVVETLKANRGIFITSSQFTRDAVKFAARNRIELLSWGVLNHLFNRYFGQSWIHHIDMEIMFAKRAQCSGANEGLNI